MSRLIFILKGYPRLSETFIAQEIRALEQRGFPIKIVSLRSPTDTHVHPVHREIAAGVAYLPEYLYQEPWRVLRSWVKAKFRRGYWRAFKQWIKDLLRDPTPNRARRFGQACVMVAELPKDTTRLHAHFIHTPASATYYAHLITGLPWSCSAHAKDIWTSPDWDKREKLATLDWLVTCTRAGYEHLREIARPEDRDKIHLVYHGLDSARFPEPPLHRRNLQAPLRILSVGRAVPKKGYADLLQALALLPKEAQWHFHHIGGGPLLEELKNLADTLQIADSITWQGAAPQDQVLEAYQAADIFVLASCIAEDGDRDGLPNVLMEAQSQKLAVIATNLPGIAELVVPGETGLLVPPNAPENLSGALLRLMRDPELRLRLAEAGYERVRQHFSLERGIDDLERRFREDG
ncbi:glycosyltransferase family 4 protein [Dongia deserti]|uniref:glycosyltransferase family 4 protein n=1 Tax=Dongia deserti TaxID=2268030 RepID=UPI000E64CED3|nr:glycosyltransferase family 4 protein [Dongia deserti]